MRKLLAVLLLPLVASCSSPQRTAALECGGGAAAAAILLCKLSGGNDKTCIPVAVGTGAAGAAICYSYADRIQKRRQALAGQEGSLDARIRYLHGVNQDTEELNRQLAAKVKSVTASTDQAVAALYAGRTSQDQLAQERAALDREVQSAQQQVATAGQELRSAQQFRAQQAAGTTGALDAEIARLQGLLAQAQANTSALAAQRQRI